MLNDIAFITKDLVRSYEYVRHAESLDVILNVRCLLKLLSQTWMLFSESIDT